MGTWLTSTLLFSRVAIDETNVIPFVPCYFWWWLFVAQRDHVDDGDDFIGVERLADHRTWPGHQHQCARIEMANSRVSFYLWPCPHVLLSSSESHPYTCQADRALCANSIITPSALSMKANVSLLQSLLSNHCTHHLTWGEGKAGRAAPTILLRLCCCSCSYYLTTTYQRTKLLSSSTSSGINCHHHQWEHHPIYLLAHQ